MVKKQRAIQEQAIIRDFLAEIGRRGGKASSQRKRESSRENGKKGGRPKAMIRKVRTIAELATLARTDDRYAKLASLSSSNLGGPTQPLDHCIAWLRTNALETGEAGVVEEINFCIDLVGVAR